MVLQRWDPFAELHDMQQTMNRLWRGFDRTGNGSVENWVVPLDVVEEGDDVIVHASLPGLKAEDIEVTIENDVLTIAGETHTESEKKENNYLMRERRSGKFHRSLRLPNTLDTDKAKTRYEDGVLTVSLPKAESKKAKRLEIKAG